MKKLLILPLLLFTLVACETYDKGAAVVAGTKTGIDDRKLEASEFGMCEDASVGSVRRRYGTSEQKMSAYNTLCNDFFELRLNKE